MTSIAPKYLISIENLKTIAQGALGAMTFGAYHQFTTNKMMELNNKIITQENQLIVQKIEQENYKMQQKMIEMEKEIQLLKK